MLTDPNFWLSVVTAMVAIIALLQTHKQTKISNKQHLFDKRVEVYLIAAGLVELYRENKQELMNCENESMLGNAVIFYYLTNNSYLSMVSKAIESPIEHPVHHAFLVKLECLKDVAARIRLLFAGWSANILGDYVLCYQELLMSMYQYEKHLDKMKLASRQCSIDIDECKIKYHDDQYRNEVISKINHLKLTYDKLVSKNVLNEIEKQIKLS